MELTLEQNLKNIITFFRSYGVEKCNSCMIFMNSYNFPLKNKKNKKGIYKQYFSKKCKFCERKVANLAFKKYKQNNPEKVKATKKKYRASHKEQINLYKEEYRIKHREKYNRRIRNYYHRVVKHNPEAKIKRNLSRTIYALLRRNNSSKNGASITKFLPYTIKELKTHLESLFEPWMNWSNNGRYDSKIWNDDDPSTWTWQLDHIIPHSTFKYTSMDSEEFRQCWALSNLRPLNAKQNNIDGISKIRHNKTIKDK